MPDFACRNRISYYEMPNTGESILTALAVPSPPGHGGHRIWRGSSSAFYLPCRGLCGFHIARRRAAAASLGPQRWICVFYRWRRNVRGCLEKFRHLRPRRRKQNFPAAAVIDLRLRLPRVLQSDIPCWGIEKEVAIAGRDPGYSREKVVPHFFFAFVKLAEPGENGQRGSSEGYSFETVKGTGV